MASNCIFRALAFSHWQDGFTLVHVVLNHLRDGLFIRQVADDTRHIRKSGKLAGLLAAVAGDFPVAFSVACFSAMISAKLKTETLAAWGLWERQPFFLLGGSFLCGSFVRGRLFLFGCFILLRSGNLRFRLFLFRGGSGLSRFRAVQGQAAFLLGVSQIFSIFHRPFTIPPFYLMA